MVVAGSAGHSTDSVGRILSQPVMAAEPPAVLVGRSHCNPKNLAGYVSQERCEVCVGGEGCYNAIPLVEKSQKAAARGDLPAAIKTMEEAIRIINSYRLGRIQRWDNLAELYCLRALEETNKKSAADLRADGLAMLNEFRCGVDIQKGRRACALPNAPNETPGEPTQWGIVPDATLTPMCYSAFCDRGFQKDDVDYLYPDPDGSDRAEWESHYEESDSIDDDAANVGKIEQLCRRGAR